jgi:hypothetical protein
MLKVSKFGWLFGLISVLLGSGDVMAAAKTAKKQAAIQFSTKVRTKVEAKGVYDQDCYDKYYSCMDQFCIVDNELGGSCNCSDDIYQYETALDDIKKMVAEAERINTEEVEKVKAGANADIIFQGTRQYDKDGNVIATTATKDKSKIKSSMWSSFYGEEEEYDEDDVSGKTGSELYEAADRLCKQEIGESCSKDMNILTQIYSRQIVSDCKGLANSVEQKRQEAKSQLSAANSNVRSALKESLEESNKYDRGTCMVEYKKCMQSTDACGSNWENCVFTIAEEKMQNDKAKSTAKTKVKTIDTYDITASTMEMLESKRFICEKVLDSCIAVRNFVWNDFLRDVAPTIRMAERNLESQKRQSCLTDISNCIQKACKDDIVGKGEATMDACLARPDMARSFCKIQIDPCERMEPQIWEYVQSKLAAMRVDACTQEVKDCLTADDRCGPDYSNCIGMDFEYIHEMCPVDKLVVCKQADPYFKMDKLDSMLMGIFLNIDNKALENCEKVAEEKMLELCGSTTDCNKFAADDVLGTGSIRSQKDGSIYRVTGMISFGSIKMGGTYIDSRARTKKDTLLPGAIDVSDYMNNVKKNVKGLQGEDYEAIASNIRAELDNIAGTINRTIAFLESDQRIQYCINGRDLGQIKGEEGKGKMTEARFPNLLNQYRVMIALSALRKAQDNYNKKVTEAISEAAKGASDDVAQYLCQRIADMGKGSSTPRGLNLDAPLTAPYAISYEVGSGLSTKDLLSVSSQGSSMVGNISDNKKGGGVLTERTAIFSRETRTCHICTTKTTSSCKQWAKWSGQSKNKECELVTSEPYCEDVKM